MPFSRVRQFFCHILTPLFEMGDGNIFHAHQTIADGADDTESYLALCTQFTSRPQTACAPIGGHQITLDWLGKLNPSDCLDQFRFYADELVHLAAIMKIPEIFRPKSRYAFPRVEALALLLARFKSAGDISDLSRRYNRSQSAISQLVNELVEFLDNRWHHLLDFDHNFLLSPARMQEYADAIHAAGAPLDSVWCFIDCTIRAICRPGFWQ
ncbi:hypothetical protein B0H16DRAFT_1767134 [Mycena metata]|uniref:Uncharacterized protein n=1 Tax=Mycena metata TaxID=1033252 RepID=A0AAD7MVD0_9AGAR|nr:hypothetical protein B0H16DRAFT_1767134 [Mycena metata]